MSSYPSGSLTNYPVSFANLSKKSIGQYLELPKLNCVRKTSIEMPSSQMMSRLITLNNSRTTITSGSKIKSNNAGLNS